MNPAVSLSDTQRPAVYTVPAGAAFADTLAAGLLAEYAGDPLKLAEVTLLLPTRRACRTVREAFLRLADGAALLLPRLVAVGDVDAEELALLHADEEALTAALDMPPAISPLQRQILLARLIQRRDPAQSFDQAAALALALGRFLDEVQNEGLSFDGLATLVPDSFAAHWQQTISFLQILTEHWPTILAERHVMDVAERRTRLIRAQVAAWTARPPAGPVIAAGTTGTTPAAAELLCLVAQLPQGCLVLPGVDLELDDAGWKAIGSEHPQSGIKALLERVGITRAEVRLWPHAEKINPARSRWLSQAMRPAETTDVWRSLGTSDITPDALTGMVRLDCATPQEEADMIALLLRETLATPEKTAALITPDRRLARRVTQSLKRWGIQIDDTGGQPLTEIMAGSYLTLLAEMAETQLAPVTLLSLLKHPLTALALPADDMRAMVYLLDEVALRGPRPRAGLDGLQQALATVDARPGDREKLLDWVKHLTAAMQPFADLMAARVPQDFAQLLDAHIALAEAVATTTDQPGRARVWRGEGGEAAALFLADLRQAAADIPPVAPRQYTSLLTTLFKGITVRPRYGSHPRIFIYGLIEARLASADRVILGGLNEGTWPALPGHDPWLSRPMRRAFGLPQPEAAVAIAAHDFVQAASRPEVFLTRAQKMDGTPTVPARWLLRMETVLHATGLDWNRADAARYHAWRGQMDEAGEPRPVQCPAPMPPAKARPDTLSVTKIETWMRDPYQIYAQYVLGLSALDPIDADPGGSERGIFIHRALETFVRDHMDRLPPDAANVLRAHGRRALAELAVPAEVEAFWWPRFERIADAFIAEEISWRRQATPYQVEARGRLVWPDFTLTAKADRLDKMPDGSYAILDYKTGQPPSAKDVLEGLSPQLPLEALMLRQGAFEGVPAGETTDLRYWQASGSGGKPLKVTSVTNKAASAADLTEQAEVGLRRLIDTYKDAQTPYISRPHAEARAQARGGDYDHLARIKEWGVSADEDDSDGEVAA